VSHAKTLSKKEKTAKGQEIQKMLQLFAQLFERFAHPDLNGFDRDLQQFSDFSIL
jgi:hypothetical protein